MPKILGSVKHGSNLRSSDLCEPWVFHGPFFCDLVAVRTLFRLGHSSTSKQTAARTRQRSTFQCFQQIVERVIQALKIG
jgi:hypothetical protein